MIKIKKYINSEIIEARKICLKNHLYVPTWSFQLWLTSGYYDIKQIFIIYKDDQPVGASIVINNDYWGVNVGFFIKKIYRRMGLGKKLIRTVSRNNKDYELSYDCGIPESRHFFQETTKRLDNLKKAL